MTLTAAVAFVAMPVACQKAGSEVEAPEKSELDIDQGDPFSVSMPVAKSEISKVSLTKDQESLVGASNALAFKMLDKLYSNKGIILSPLSLYLSLGMAVNGADGETAKELSALLGGDADAVNAFAKALLEQIPAADLKTTVRIADALVVNNKYQLKKEFKSSVESNFYAPAENVSFANPRSVKDMVNSWCSRQTEGLIPSILDDVSKDVMAILLNAIYFKSQWSEPFADFQVSKLAFTGASKEIDFLCEQGNMFYLDKGDYHIVSRDYSNGKYKFYILLPKAKDGLASMLSSLNKDNWASLATSMEPATVQLRFPKIDTASEMSLKDFLLKMGVKSAFSTDADFSSMFEKDNTFISDILQKAKISVNEYGTEAAAVTATLFASSAGPGAVKPVQFIADHPFAYVIAESTSNTILFSGIFNGK